MRKSDVAVAGGVIAVAVAGLLAGAVLTREPLFRLDAAAIVIAVVQGGVLLWRRRFPVAVLIVSTTVVAAHIFVRHPNAGAEFGPFVAAFAVGACASLRVGVPVVVVASALLAWLPHTDPGLAPGLVVASGDTSPAAAASVTTVAMFAVAFLLGWAVRSRRESAAARLDAALSQERTRIARELHDVIAHHVGAMVVQAGAGRRVLERDGDVEQAREALSAIETSGRAALTAVPMLVGALRGDSGDVAPQPSLARLEDLTSAAEQAGLSVDLEIDGTPRELPASVDLSGYRIVQEAVTNAIKHAGPANVQIRLRYGGDALDITVADDGIGGGAGVSSGRYGLAGMRERVALLGGRLEVGPRSGGGFAVHASLPLHQS